MRYLTIPTYQFTDVTGRTIEVKEMRELEDLPVSLTMNRAAQDDFDEIASRSYVYGDGGERDAYKLHEANIVAILDARFDYSRVLSIKVPL